MTSSQNDAKESEYPADLNCTNRIAELLSDRMFQWKVNCVSHSTSQIFNNNTATVLFRTVLHTKKTSTKRLAIGNFI